MASCKIRANLTRICHQRSSLEGSAASRVAKRVLLLSRQSRDARLPNELPPLVGIEMDTIRANEVIESALVSGNKHIGEMFDADVIIMRCVLTFGLDDFVRDEIEYLKEQDSTKNTLVVILETTGGYIEVVERIVSVFRRHFMVVNFVIPNYAYSAGTVLALSGDEIYMDYYSVLGPIDPQFQTESGEPVPGMGYIAKYDELLKTINEVPDDKIETVKAEMAFLLKKFDPAKLFHIEQAVEHSKGLIKAWLPKYKFKKWEKPETRGADVTEHYKVERATRIAQVLADAKHWHSHGRGISRHDLESEEIGLKTVDFGSNPNLNNNIRHYHGLFTDYMDKLDVKSAIHSRRGLRRAM